MMNKGWKEAAIAWEVCASIHREYAKGNDALFKTRQNDFVNAANKARVKAQAPTPPAQQDVDSNPWHAAIDNELVCCHILNEANHNDPRKALQDIINWHVQVALDPAVSSEAQKLIERGQQQDDEALELLRILLIERDGHYSTKATWDRVRALIEKRGAA